MKLYPALQRYLDELPNTIDHDRTKLWMQVAGRIRSRTDKQALSFICTHNARRSALSQSWAHALVFLYEHLDFPVYSGGAEATFIHPHSIQTLRELGFEVNEIQPGDNPVYLVKAGEDDPGFRLFSKKFDDPSSELPYHAILVCSKSDVACPFIPQALSRNLIPFEDPGLHDEEPDWSNYYQQSSKEIATELKYLFSLL